MASGNHLRYAQLSDEQLKAIESRSKNVIVSSELNSYVGPKENLEFFERALEKLQATLAGCACAEEFASAFVIWSNNPDRKAKLLFERMHSRIANSWVNYLKRRNFESLRTEEITRLIIDDFIKFIRKECHVSYSTQRGYWGAFRSLLEVIRESPRLRHRLSPELSWPSRPFRREGASHNPTEALDAATLRALLVACRAEAAETIREFRELRPIIEGGNPYLGDQDLDSRGRYKTIESALWRLKEIGLLPIPCLADIKKIDGNLGNAIQFFHGMRAVILPFYPSADRLVPFILLHAIYTSGNTGSLLGMRLRQITHKKVMGVKRIVYRFVKPRAKGQYSRSFAHQDDDILSPAMLHSFLLEWTSLIRGKAGKFAGNLYVFGTREGTVRGFLTGAQAGVSFDVLWKRGLENFIDRHKLPKFGIKNLRTTGLDLVRVLSGDDLRAVQAAGGQKSGQVVQAHYEGASARNRRNEALSEVMTTMEGWVGSAGTLDPRVTPTYSDILAATPGWHCADPFDSPVPGEIKGRRCQAFGRCPGCPFGAVNKFSAYSLARALQLLDEVINARAYLDVRRWSAAYEEVQLALQNRWIPSFDDESVWEEAKKLSLNPLGRLE
ncbi:hypothetical protein [Cupriavidus sp. D384]|uniref:hypothetical protein n=1 Tax=Cupriavidus sp. D384 TaxID=1538095 RepID=UPI000AD4A3FF|nr:hypothetical protein [Cupriavidus sp. D384]